MRREKITGNCGVPYLANRPALEASFDANHELTHLVIITSQNSVGQAILDRAGRNNERCSQQQGAGGVPGVRLYPAQFTTEIKACPRKRRHVGDRRYWLHSRRK